MAAALIPYLWPVHLVFKVPSRFKEVTKTVTHKAEYYLPFTFKTGKLKWKKPVFGQILKQKELKK